MLYVVKSAKSLEPKVRSVILGKLFVQLKVNLSSLTSSEDKVLCVS